MRRLPAHLLDGSTAEPGQVPTAQADGTVNWAPGGGGRWEVLMVDGLPLSTPDGADWIYVEVPA